MTPSEIEFTESAAEKLDEIRVQIGRLARMFEGMHGPAANLVAKMLIGSKEIIGRIDYADVLAAYRGHVASQSDRT
jgi:hypothetical protein